MKKEKSILSVAAFVVGAAAVGLFLSIKPWQAFREQSHKAAQSVAEMNAAEKSRADLMKRKAKLESEVGKEEQARNQGYRKPNEKPADGGP